MAVNDITNTGCDIYYRLINTQKNKEIAKAKTGIVFYDYKNWKVARVPEVFLEVFKL